MRCSAVRLFQCTMTVGGFTLVMLMLSSSNYDKADNSRSTNVITGIKRLISTNSSQHKMWDPLSLFKDEENSEMPADNVLFKPDQENYAKTQKRDCSPQKDFIFVKVHKAGSTTLISIVQRFGYQHNLTFVLPKRGDIFLGWPYHLDIEKHVLPLLNGGMEFNILTNHAVFDRAALTQVVPNNPKFMGIVRNPLTHFKSSMNYFQKLLTPENEVGKYSMMERIIRFAENPTYYDGINDKNRYNKDPNRHIHSVTKNLQAADFGMEFADMENSTMVDQFMADIEKNFPFLLVMEHMHESLLLLRRRWCWQLKDILYLQKNVFKYKGKSEPIPAESADLLLSRWLAIDHRLYTWANETLWRAIKQEQDFHMELAYYKSINNLVGSYCQTNIQLVRKHGGDVHVALNTLEIAASYWNEPFTVTYNDCKDLIRFEIAFTRLLQSKQRPDLYDEEYYQEANDGITPHKNKPDLRQARKAIIT